LKGNAALETDGVLVGDEVKITIDIEGVKMKPTKYSWAVPSLIASLRGSLGLGKSLELYKRTQS